MTHELLIAQTVTGDAIVLRPGGDIDMARAPSVRKAVAEVMRTRPQKLIIDLSSVSYMDSSGIATLVEALQHAMRNKMKFVLVGITPRVKSAFEISRLLGLFTSAPTLEDALRL
ncbi:MAG: anti-sigma factor antagonist [Phycisphaerales bacterium]|nr:anti-sigma factor antagonist [Phycisphaerales bacterium]